MNRAALMALVMALISGLVLAAAAAGDGGAHRMLLKDNFASAHKGDWTFFNRVGQIESKRLWIDGEYMSNSVSRDGWALTHIGDTAWNDYVFDVSYNNDNIGGSPDHHMATVYFRVASEDGNVRQTMYRVDVWAGGDRYESGSGDCGGLYQTLPNGWVQLTKIVNGATTVDQETCTSNAATGDNTLEVAVEGGDITVVSNGQTVLTYTDSNPIASGGVGVGQVWETNGSYDNVVVRAFN